jgi:hypothetical protein
LCAVRGLWQDVERDLVATGCNRTDGHSGLAPAQQTQNKLESYLFSVLGAKELRRKTKVLVMENNYVF